MEKAILLIVLFAFAIALSGCVEPTFCGDDICESDSGETPENCPIDCVVEPPKEDCSITGNFTTVEIGNNKVAFTDNRGNMQTYPFVLELSYTDKNWSSFSLNGFTYYLRVDEEGQFQGRGDGTLEIRKDSQTGEAILNWDGRDYKENFFNWAAFRIHGFESGPQSVGYVFVIDESIDKIWLLLTSSYAGGLEYLKVNSFRGTDQDDHDVQGTEYDYYIPNKPEFSQWDAPGTQSDNYNAIFTQSEIDPAVTSIKIFVDPYTNNISAAKPVWRSGISSDPSYDVYPLQGGTGCTKTQFGTVLTASNGVLTIQIPEN